MGRNPCCLKQKLRKGLWSPEEDEKLFNYITRFGVGCWSSVPKQAGLQRCGKSCRLRWVNYLRPDLKRGMFSQQEEDLIIRLHEVLGNRWAQIAAQLSGRTDNEIKNFWNSCLKKKLRQRGIDPNTHKRMGNFEVQQERKCIEEGSSQPSQPKHNRSISSSELGPEVLISNSIYYDARFNEASEEHILTKPVFDPFPSFEFQQGTLGTNNSNLLSHYLQNFRPSDQTHLETNSDFGLTSMPCLTTCDYSNVTEKEISGNSTSRMSTLFFNETKQSSSNTCNMYSPAEFQISNMGENVNFPSGFMLQYQLNGIKSEELKLCSWQEEQQHTQSSEDFGSFPLLSLPEDLTGANFDPFEQI